MICKRLQLCDNQEFPVTYFSNFLVLEKQIFCKLCSTDFCTLNIRHQIRGLCWISGESLRGWSCAPTGSSVLFRTLRHPLKLCCRAEEDPERTGGREGGENKKSLCWLAGDREHSDSSLHTTWKIIQEKKSCKDSKEQNAMDRILLLYLEQRFNGSLIVNHCLRETGLSSLSLC